jgi:hypothetical protein
MCLNKIEQQRRSIASPGGLLGFEAKKIFVMFKEEVMNVLC